MPAFRSIGNEEKSGELYYLARRKKISITAQRAAKLSGLKLVRGSSV